MGRFYLKSMHFQIYLSLDVTISHWNLNFLFSIVCSIELYLSWFEFWWIEKRCFRANDQHEMSVSESLIKVSLSCRVFDSANWASDFLLLFKFITNVHLCWQFECIKFSFFYTSFPFDTFLSNLSVSSVVVEY